MPATLEITYRKAQSHAVRELRMLTPRELRRSRRGADYLIAYDHDRHAERCFRVDRIESVRHLNPTQSNGTD